MPDLIPEFREEYSFLSNFFIEPDGTFVEAEFQAAKTLDLRAKVEILIADTPQIAKRLGRRVKKREDWEEIRYQVMRDLVLRKFLDHPTLSESLFGTGDAVLIEGNRWHDNYWGICNCVRCEDRDGGNNLGLILMEIRELIGNW